jgi:membrane fusion protein (multidrug efflux system)
VDERFLAVPVTATDGRTLAVLTARRDGSRSPFSEREGERLQLLAEQVAPALGRLVLRRQIEDRGRYEGVGEEAVRLFRREALDHHTRGFGDQGDLLHISPAWTPWAFRVVVLVFVAAVAYSLLGSIHEYASGPAVVRVEGRSDVTAAVAGTVMAIEVGAEERVEAGQLLVRFYGAQEAAELERIRREFELGLINRLRNPADPSTERALGALQAQKRLAEARLEERSVRAPHGGIVSDLRVRAGQHLVPGEVILSLRGESPQLAILALLPGQYRPLLRPGMTLRFEPRGYRYAYQQLTIDRIDDEIVGPNEARRFLGAGIGDAVPLSGPVVFVHARLPDRTFESGGRSYEYHEGILGTAEARVRSERILTALLPGLEAVFGGSGG